MSFDIKPRDKFIHLGGESLTDVELLSIILQTGSRKMSVNILSLYLIEKYGSLKSVIEQPISELIENDGIGEVKAIKIKSIYYMIRSMKKNETKKIKVSNAKDLYNVVSMYEDNPEENFYIILLNNNNEIINLRHLFKGSISSVTVSLREIFKEAFLVNAKSICLVHNHPSGNLTPSFGDIEMTKNVIYYSDGIGIKILDHIIIGVKGYYSFKENGLLS